MARQQTNLLAAYNRSMNGQLSGKPASFGALDQESRSSMTPTRDIPNAISSNQIVIIGCAPYLCFQNTPIGLPGVSPNCDEDHTPSPNCIK
jgi:hypothetical protein